MLAVIKSHTITTEAKSEHPLIKKQITMHKYNFFGNVRTYRNRLQLIGDNVIYLGITNEQINHWVQSVPFVATEKTIQKVIPDKILVPDNFKPNEEIEQFLKDTEAYDKAAFKPEQLIMGKTKLYHYIIDGVNRYYHVKHPVEWFDLSLKKSVVYVGIKYKLPDKKINEPIKYKDIASFKGLCCYCEIPLNKGINYTKEHVIPVSRGGKNGKNIRPCCADCNTEKGNLMLHSYIQLLNYQLADKKGDELIKLQIKIANANRIAKEIENK